MDKESNLAYLAAAGLLGGGGYLAYRQYKSGKRKAEYRDIPMHKVDSSMIRELGYSPKRRVMHAKFNTGRRYRYEDVPLKQYRRLREAESIGSHFNSNIRGKYEHEKIAFKGMIGGALLGAATGGVMRDAQGNAGGLGGALTGAMVGGAAGHLVAKGLKGIPKPKIAPTAPATPPNLPAPPPRALPAPPPRALPAPPPKPGFMQGLRDRLRGAFDRYSQQMEGFTPPFHQNIKLGSLESGITLISDETFEKSAYVAPGLSTVVAQSAVGAAAGAAVNSENRLRGALVGGLIGGAAGGVLGRMGGSAIAKSGLDDAGRQMYKEQVKRLNTQLSSAKGSTNRASTIESFIANPANKEFASVYRQSMLSGTIGAAGMGAIAAVNDPEKRAAYRAVERFHNVRSH